MCYLTAHKEAQSRTRDVLGSYTKDEWSAEVTMVVNESVKSEQIAIEYYNQLETLALGEESMTQLTRGLRARRAALELTARLSNYIHHLHLDGAIQDAEEHELLHTLEHDTEHLKGVVAPTLAKSHWSVHGGGTAARPGVSLHVDLYAAICLHALTMFAAENLPAPRLRRRIGACRTCCSR